MIDLPLEEEWCEWRHTMAINFTKQAGRSTPVAQLAPRNLLTRWDVSSIPANGIFLTKKLKKQK